MKKSQQDQITVGMVQISEMNWRHICKPVRFTSINGFLMPINPPKSEEPEEEGAFIYLPYAVGLLQAYVQKHAKQPDRFQFLLPLYKRIFVDDAVVQLKDADVVGFSAYVWNIRISIEIARRLKENNPDVLIVFGGLQVPKNTEPLLRENPFIDIAVVGEGESIFLDILENCESRDWRQIQSVAYIDSDGKYVSNPRESRISDLSVVPSPYLEGTFQPLMDANPTLNWMPLWETNRGCPFTCAYCDWGAATSKRIYRFDYDRLVAECDFFAEKNFFHITFCDANFGALKRDIDVIQSLIDAYAKRKGHVFVSIQDTKNFPDRSFEIQKTLYDAGASSEGATLAVQSLSPVTLENVKRENISMEAFNKLQRRFKREGIPTVTDIVMALPGETYDSFADGISCLIRNGQHSRIAFYNCIVLPNAEIGQAEYRARHDIQTVPVQIIHEHEVIEDETRDECPEYVDFIVSTKDMTSQQWLKTRVFAWMTDFLHFNKVLQLTLVTVAEHWNVEYRTLIELFIDADEKMYPVVGELTSIFTQKARRVQGGGPELIPAPEWRGLFWPADQYALVKLVVEERVDDFYREAYRLIDTFLSTAAIPNYDSALLSQALELNQSLLKLPEKYKMIELSLDYNIFEFYRGTLDGTPVSLMQVPSRYKVDCASLVWMSWESWCDEMVTQRFNRDFNYYKLNVVSE